MAYRGDLPNCCASDMRLFQGVDDKAPQQGVEAVTADGLSSSPADRRAAARTVEPTAAPWGQ